MKKGRLSTEEKTFIFQNKSKMSVEDIAKKLERSQDVVKVIIQSNWQPNKVSTGVNLKDGAFGKKEGVAVMSEGASMAADEFSQNVSARKQVDYIHKIDPNKRIR